MPESLSEFNSRRAAGVVAGGTLIMLLLGVAYVWGVYVDPLIAAFGWTRAQASLPFSVFLLAYTAGMIVGGRLQDRYGPRGVCLAGAALFGSGYFLSGFASGLTYLCVVYGAVGGLGTGFAYVTPVATVVKWFPSRKGLMGGVVIFGFGFGAFVFSPLVSRIIESFGWTRAFFSLGLLFILLGTAASWLMVPPPRKPEDGPGDPGKPKVADIPPFAVLKAPAFWMAWSVWFLALAVGLGTMGHIVPYAVETGIEPLAAALILSVVAIFNGAGRVILGAVSDRIGRFRVLSGACWGMAAVPVLLIAAGGNLLPLSATGILFGLAFGALLILYPVLAADLFGTKHLGTNYGLLFSSYGFAGFAGPVLFGSIYDATGGYGMVFIISAGLCLAAGFLAAALKRYGSGTSGGTN